MVAIAVSQESHAGRRHGVRTTRTWRGTRVAKRLLTSMLMAALAALALGCDPLAPTDYPGEVLGSIEGVAIVRPGSPSPPETEIALVWASGVDGDRLRMVSEKVAVSAKLPAAWRIDFRHPPPRQAMLIVNEIGIAIGGLLAFEAGRIANGQVIAVDTDGDLGPPPGGGPPAVPYLLGHAENDAVVYLDRDIEPSHPLSVSFGGIHRAGFHAVTIGPVSQAEAEVRANACRKLYPGGACMPDLVDAVPSPPGYRVVLEIGWPRANAP